MNRRRFLTLALAAAVAPQSQLFAEPASRKGDYAADVAILYRAFTLRFTGTMDEVIDRTAGRYEVTIRGEGSQIANRIESQGMLRDGRWATLRTTSWFQVVGRESQTTLLYDYASGTADYRHRSETFLLRRQRIGEDVLSIPAGHVDDAIS